MATVGPSLIVDQTSGGMMRLRGSLAPGTILVNGNVYRERLRMPANAVSADARCKMAVAGGTPTVQLVAQTGDKSGNDLTVSDAASGLAAPTLLLNNQEATHTYIPKGETFVDVVVDCTGAAASGTLTYCDVGSRLA